MKLSKDDLSSKSMSKFKITMPKEPALINEATTEQMLLKRKISEKFLKELKLKIEMYDCGIFTASEVLTYISNTVIVVNSEISDINT